MNQPLLKPLILTAGYQTLISPTGELAAVSLNQEALLISAAFSELKRSIVVIKPTRYEALKLYELISSLVNETELFQVEDSLRLEAIASSPEVKAERILTLNKLGQQPLVLVTHTAAMMRYFPAPTIFQQFTLQLAVNQEISMEEVTTLLQQAGYEKVAQVDRPLTYARRGGIIDVFSINYHQPLRLEFFDVILESIRLIDLNSQRTSSTLVKAEILPASDLLFTKEQLALISEQLKQTYPAKSELLANSLAEMEYLKAGLLFEKYYRYQAELPKPSSLLAYLSKPLVVLSPVEEIYQQEQQILTDSAEFLAELTAEQVFVSAKPLYFSLAEILKTVFNKRIYTFKPEAVSVAEIRPNENIKENFEVLLSKIIKEATKAKVIICLTGNYLARFKNILNERQLSYQLLSTTKPPKIGLNLLDSSNRVSYEFQEMIVYTALDLFDHVARPTRFTNQFLQAELTADVQELNPGDYVVHNLYGIGQFQAIITREINGLTKDYLQILYRDQAELLVPLEQFSLVRKYVSSEGIIPRLHKLGTKEWLKTKERLAKNVSELADRLVKLYSVRQEMIGFPFSPDNKLQAAFEADIDFELTKDQQTSIKEIKTDMEKPYPMDRLLCGDVGFGKTEVAMRAAFKAVLDQKQVVFLCPTTILSRQHYLTFKQRFANFPVNIALLNRFVLPKEQARLVKEIALGHYDIIIGTHRLLSADVKFQDLGLLIIDEEQRFGVEHKEKIKELKQAIDVLALSATPIPRTLQMSLISVRALSQLNTPPIERLPVQTYVVEKNFALTISIIAKEIARGGQVFYLFNNIEHIYTIAYQLQQALPQANIAVAHGQMSREEIEDVMVKFTDNHYQVLVCTTIIETGIDIANANTIIIDQAQNFGLAQLYQIRGRVGRSDRLAYAYLLIPPRQQLTEIAEKRLKAIKEFTELGSGYKIALRDLTIRGAGDLLGENQSGFIDSVGVELYLEMLKAAIKKATNQAPEPSALPRIPMAVNAYIPANLTDSDLDKLSLYQKIDKIKSTQELKQVYLAATDYFGKLPNAVSLLFEKKRLELFLQRPEIESFKEREKEVVLTYTNEFSDQVDGIKLFETINEIDPAIKLKYLKGTIRVIIPKQANWLDLTITVINRVRKVKR